jgi:hypothetical protein
MAGELSGMAITQGFLLAVSLYIAIASVTVFLSLVLSPTVPRMAAASNTEAAASSSLVPAVDDGRTVSELKFSEPCSQRLRLVCW